MSRVLIWLLAAVAGGAIGIAVLWLIATIFNPDNIVPAEEPQSTATLVTVRDARTPGGEEETLEGNPPGVDSVQSADSGSEDQEQ